MIIKVCGMREKENIQDLMDNCAPDMVGLIFYEGSSRFVEKKKADSDFFQEIKIPKVGVFVNETQDYILGKINEYGLQFVQLHGDEPVEFVKGLKSVANVKVIKVFRVGEKLDWDRIKEYEIWVDWFLFDTQTKQFGGSGKQFDWKLLERYPLEKQFLLSGGIDGGSVGIIKELSSKIPQLKGVDINSKFEKEPGLKDLKKVHKFINELRIKK